MSRVHDMGGRFGDGPIPEKEDDVVFHTEWEAHAMALNVLSGAMGAWNIDASRHQREKIAPQDYAGFSYYEKWMAGLTDLGVERGLWTVEDLSAPDQIAQHALNPKALKPDDILPSQRVVKPYSRDAETPVFEVGQKVRTRRAGNVNVPGGHTRLPRYAENCVGRIVTLHGAHVFPDSNAHWAGEAPQPLYAVAFKAQDLWGAGAEDPEDQMVLDLWESYLEPADDTL